jgi:hypothetical protein
MYYIRGKIWLCSVLMSLALIILSRAATITVSSDAELNNAISNAAGGDVIVLKDGTYSSLTIKDKNYSTPLTVKAENAEGPQFSAATVENSNGVIVDGIKVNMSEGQFYGFTVRNSHTVTVQNCNIYAADFNIGKNLFLTAGTKDILIKGNNISTTNDGVHTTGSLENITFVENIIAIRPGKVPQGAHYDIFQFRSGPIRGLKIHRNYLAHSSQNIFLEAVGSAPWRDIEIIGNISVTQGTNDLAGKHISMAPVENLRVEGNTLATISTSGEAYSHGLSVTVTGTYAVKGNIFFNALYMSVGKESDYNLHYHTNIKKFMGIGGHGTLAAFQSANPGKGLNSIQADPLFMDHMNEDFRLQAGSPAIDKGTTLTTDPVDYFGTARPQGNAWDIGAVEWQAALINKWKQVVKGQSSIQVNPNPMTDKIQFIVKTGLRPVSTIMVYDNAGNAVHHTVGANGGSPLQWLGTDITGQPVKPGVYFYRINNGPDTYTGRIIKTR